jgi:hypothetical protein
MKGMYGSSSIHSIHSLWYVEAQRDLSNQLKTSLLAPLPTYLMTEAFLTEFNSKKLIDSQNLYSEDQEVYYPHDNGQNCAYPLGHRVLAFAHDGVINASLLKCSACKKTSSFLPQYINHHSACVR